MKKNILMFLTPKEETLYLNYNSTIRQVIEKFDYYKFSVIPLIDDDGNYVTTISEGDILRFIKSECNFNLQIAESMYINCVPLYRPYEALSVFTPFDDLLDIILEQNFVPVVDDRNKFIGIVKRRSIIETINKEVI